jgi:RNA polymerase sigma-70 factor (ECF subfamily)
MQNIEEIYEEYFETVNKYLFCLTHNKEISDDLTQETFCRAVENINAFRNECKISVWLCQIAKNLWYNELKKNKKMDHIDDEHISMIPSKEEVENDVISNSNKLELYKRLQKLDKQTREVVYLRITGELSFKEIADILNKTENWARVTYYRGKLKLKEGDDNER